MAPSQNSAMTNQQNDAAVLSSSHTDVALNETKPDAPESEEEQENEEYLTGFKLAAIVGSLTLVVFLLMLDQAILGTAIPRIASEFHSLSDVGWYTGTYQLANAAFQPITGKLYTNFRAKWVFFVFAFIFELGSLICGLANSSMMLIVGRAIAGLGGSGLMNGGMTIISGATPLEKRPLFTGLIVGTGQIGIVTGPIIGGAFTEYVTWRWCFYINLPLGVLVAIFMALIDIPDITKKEPVSMDLIRRVIPQLDPFGFAMFVPSAIMFLLALQFGSGQAYAWNSPVIIGLFCGAGGLAILFILWEARIGDRAMLPGSVLRPRIVWVSCIVLISFAFCLFAASSFMPLYFQAVKGLSPNISGIYTLPSIISQLIFIIIVGVTISKTGYYLPFAVAGAVVTAIGCGLVSTFSPSTQLGTLIGYQIVLGAGRGMSMQLAMIAVQNALPPSKIPLGLAFLIFLQNFAGSVSMVIATAVFTQTLVSQISKYAPSVSPEAVLAAGGGADAVRALVPPDSPELDGVLMTYTLAFQNVFYLLTGMAALGFIVSWGMGWKDTRRKKSTKKPIKESTDSTEKK